MRQEMMRFWDAAASAGPYANNLHLAPERQPHQHLIAQFLQARLINPTTVSGMFYRLHGRTPNQQHQCSEGKKLSKNGTTHKNNNCLM